MASYAENVSIWWRHHGDATGPGNFLIPSRCRDQCWNIGEAKVWTNSPHPNVHLAVKALQFNGYCFQDCYISGKDELTCWNRHMFLNHTVNKIDVYSIKIHEHMLNHICWFRPMNSSYVCIFFSAITIALYIGHTAYQGWYIRTCLGESMYILVTYIKWLIHILPKPW